MNLELNIYKHVKNIGINNSFLKNIVEEVFHITKNNLGTISVHFIGDKRMKTLNFKYRGLNKTTDVLSFASQEGFVVGNSNDLGDVFVSVSQIKRQAKERNITYKEELSRMIAHGILHLLGYDHYYKKEEKIMFGLQEKVVNKFV